MRCNSKLSDWRSRNWASPSMVFIGLLYFGHPPGKSAGSFFTGSQLQAGASINSFVAIPLQTSFQVSAAITLNIWADPDAELTTNKRDLSCLDRKNCMGDPGQDGWRC